MVISNNNNIMRMMMVMPVTMVDDVDGGGYEPKYDRMMMVMPVTMVAMMVVVTLMDVAMNPKLTILSHG